jgi:mono/diheme cytochrome c family protein
MRAIIILSLLVSCNAPHNSLNVGKSIYMQNCIKCHGANPNYAGSLGPDLVSTPRDVLKSKVVDGTYPEDYEPKRKSKLMPKFPQLSENIEALHLYIQSFKGVK